MSILRSCVLALVLSFPVLAADKPSDDTATKSPQPTTRVHFRILDGNGQGHAGHGLHHRHDQGRGPPAARGSRVHAAVHHRAVLLGVPDCPRRSPASSTATGSARSARPWARATTTDRSYVYELRPSLPYWTEPVMYQVLGDFDIDLPAGQVADRCPARHRERPGHPGVHHRRRRERTDPDHRAEALDQHARPRLVGRRRARASHHHDRRAPRVPAQLGGRQRPERGQHPVHGRPQELSGSRSPATASPSARSAATTPWPAARRSREAPSATSSA